MPDNVVKDDPEDVAAEIKDPDGKPVFTSTQLSDRESPRLPSARRAAGSGCRTVSMSSQRAREALQCPTVAL